jgi:hypothetical protein
MPLRGDFGGLRGLIGKLQRAAGGALTRSESHLMQEALAKTREEVVECFLYQRDPDGAPWAARKTVYGNYRDTNPILFDLLSYMEFQIVDGKVKVTNRKYYAFYHQTGTRRMVARPFLPTRSAPGKLFDRLKLGAARALRGFFGSGPDPSEGYYESYELTRG